MQRSDGPRWKSRTSGGASRHEKESDANAGMRGRRLSAARWRLSVESGSEIWRSTVSLAHDRGWGSQVPAVASIGLKPFEGDCPLHGRGTRQASRPRCTWPLRSPDGILETVRGCRSRSVARARHPEARRPCRKCEQEHGCGPKAPGAERDVRRDVGARPVFGRGVLRPEPRGESHLVMAAQHPDGGAHAWGPGWRGSRRSRGVARGFHADLRNSKLKAVWISSVAR
jgi:hypothetical protein